jgi:hypothetical protein
MRDFPLTSRHRLSINNDVPDEENSAKGVSRNNFQGWPRRAAEPDNPTFRCVAWLFLECGAFPPLCFACCALTTERKKAAGKRRTPKKQSSAAGSAETKLDVDAPQDRGHSNDFIMEAPRGQ